MTRSGLAWAPAVLLAVGAAATLGLDRERHMALRVSLAAALPRDLGTLTGTDLAISDAERQVAGVSAYLLRRYAPPDASAEPPDRPQPSWLTVYVGYYDHQTSGRTIHSPKNCLPGAGWQALASNRVAIATADGPVTVNRYLLQRETERALVLYWYQGRGRVEASEYAVKWDLLRDAALRGRTEEALVRVVVPVTDSETQAFSWATRAAVALLPSLRRALPA